MYDNAPRFDLWTDLRSLEGALAGEHRARAAVSIAHSQELSLAPAVPAHRANDASYEAVLGRWLDMLQASAPGGVGPASSTATTSGVSIFSRMSCATRSPTLTL